jgi:hypothetical protein
MSYIESKGKELNDAFDTKTAISALYLWLLFGFLSTMISCDFNRWMNNIWFRHFVGIVAFFFLFTVIDASNTAYIGTVWLKTILVYMIFLLMVKSKWYFSIPVLLLLIIDQSIKLHHDYMKNRNKQDPSLESFITWRNYLSIAIYTIIGIGFIHYGLRQYKHFGSAFSWIKLLVHYGCKGM